MTALDPVQAVERQLEAIFAGIERLVDIVVELTEPGHPARTEAAEILRDALARVEEQYR